MLRAEVRRGAAMVGIRQWLLAFLRRLRRRQGEEARDPGRVHARQEAARNAARAAESGVGHGPPPFG
jgi:hypothetical protein